MTQLPLTLQPAVPIAPAIARNSDPGTSHAGALEVTQSGRRVSHCELVLAVVSNQPVLTYREIHRALEGRIVEAVEVMRRLASDLAPVDPITGEESPGSAVVRGAIRKCSVSGRPAYTWKPREEKPCTNR